MQLQYSYYKDALQSSLIIRLPAGEQGDTGYQYRMLAANRMDGLAPCTIRHVDGETLLYYETTAAVSLAALCVRRKLGASEVRMLLYELARVIRTMSAYLLDADGLFLSPEFVFCRLSPSGEEHFLFIYYPAEKQPVQSVHEFYAFLNEHADMSDRQTAMAVLSLSEQSEGENFILSESMLNGWYEAPVSFSEAAETAPAGVATGSAADDSTDCADVLRRGAGNGEGRYLDGWEDENEESDAGNDAVKEAEADPEKKKPVKKTEKTRIIFALSILFLLCGMGLTAFRIRMPAAFEWNVPSEAAVLVLFVVSAALSILGAVLSFRTDRKENEEKSAERLRKEKEELVEASLP